MIVILGNGILGSELSRQTNWANISRQIDGFDICKKETYNVIPKSCTVIINCIANTNTWSNKRDLHWETNYVGVHTLIQFCNEKNIKLVHISTDYVYVGNKESHLLSGTTEEHPPANAANWYSYTKLLGDGLVQLLSKNYLVCRCSHKEIPFPYENAYTNKYGNFDYVDTIAKLIIGLINVEAIGIYNVGTQPKTIYDLAKQTRFDVIPVKTPKGIPTYSIMNVEKMKNALNYTCINVCPISGTNSGFSYFDLGNFPLVNNLHNTREESLNCDRYPLTINYWKDSTLSSLSCAVNSELLFSNYLFKSAVNIPYITHCKKMFHYIDALANFKTGDLIVDIGGNDGTLLSAFKEETIKELAFLNIDPSKNLAPLSEAKGIPTLIKFFSEEIHIQPSPMVVISTNVFQHLKDINSFVKGVKNMLDDKGFWVLEFPHWIHDLETMQFDQIYHEHMYYYTVTSLKMIMEKHGMKLINAEMQKIHGGSIRLVIVKEEFNYPVSNSVYEFLEKEKSFDEDYYEKWGETIKKHLQICLDKIKEIKNSGKTIAGFGAAAKGCVFLNALGITDAEIDYIIDDTDIKQGKYIPGTGIQVVGREVLKKAQPDYIIILAHNFVEHIIESLPEYKGTFIVCLPKLIFHN